MPKASKAVESAEPADEVAALTIARTNTPLASGVVVVELAVVQADGTKARARYELAADELGTKRDAACYAEAAATLGA